MKKLVFALVMVLMMSFNAVVGAAPSNGSILNEEEKITSKVFDALAGKGQYLTEVSPYLTKSLAKNFNSAQFNKAKSESTSNFGKLQNLKLFSLQKYDKADRLIYIATGTKVPAVEIGFVFDTTTSKVLLDGITMRPVEIKQPAAAQKK